MAVGECISYGSACPSLIIPSLHEMGVLPLTGSAMCLLDLINKNLKITPRLLMSRYCVWIGELAKNKEALLERIDESLIRSVHFFLTNNTTFGLSPVSELAIDSSSLVRLAPLAFYLARYEEMFSKNPPFMYHLIHELSALTVGHRRASVAVGIYLIIARDLIIARVAKNKYLTPTQTKQVARLAINKALIYYNSTYEYRGETGHYALLQFNKFQQMHLETVTIKELGKTKYAVDTLLLSLCIFFRYPHFSGALRQLEVIKLPDVGALTASLYAIAYGAELNITYKKRFEQMLGS